MSPHFQPALETDHRINCRVAIPRSGGPDNTYDISSFQKQSNATHPPTFIKFRPASVSPGMPGYCLHPLRDDVPLVDPCSGFMSPGADADLRPGTGKTISSLVDKNDGTPQHSHFWEHRSHLQRCKTALPCSLTNGQVYAKQSPPNDLHEDVHLRDFIHKQGTTWNSAARSDAALRAKLGGWTSNTKVIPQLTNGRGTFLAPNLVLQQSYDSGSRDDMVHKYMYTSSTQRAYEDVPWDIKLPAKLKPPESTLEKMPDPISQHFTIKRYEPEPQYWQIAGGIWDRFQTRMFHGQKKPLTFISPYPHMDHIPGYSGYIGSVNTEDIDNPKEVFTPFTKVRTEKPRYTNTAHTPNIPGYTGRVHWIAIHPANSNLSSPPFDADTKMNGLLSESRSGSAKKRQGPLSRMVTTVSPCNPYNKVEREMIL
ncbi:protein SPMIP7 [Gastrophryne carolinensis]